MNPTASDDAESSDPPYVFRSWRLVCAVSFLVYAALGAVLPALSLFLRERLHLVMWQAAVVYSALPFGVALALPILRAAKRSGYDARLGLALAQLVAAGWMMAAAWSGQHGYFDRADWRWLTLIVLGASVLFPLTTSWLNELATKTAPSNPQASREWRLWGAVGFALPAWTLEFIVSRWPSPDWGTYETLFAISGWSSMAAVVLMLFARTQESDTTALDDDTPVTPRFSGGESIIAVLLMMAVLQRCHEFWMAPFIQDVLRQHHIELPLVLRLSVVWHMFELVTLYGISRIISQLGLRGTMLAALIGWLARCVLLGWISQTLPSPRTALTALFLAQMLGGISTVCGLAPAALLLRNDPSDQPGSFGNAVRRMSLVGCLGVLLFGTLSAGLLEAQAPHWIQLATSKLPDDITFGRWLLHLRGWAGVWFLSAVLPLAMLPFVMLTRFRWLQTESRETAPDQDAESLDLSTPQ